MSNPFIDGNFNCCTCPEPPDFDPEVDDPLPKYINQCGCPEVIIECESEEKEPELCGFVEFADGTAEPPIVPSIPPKKYKVKTTVDQETILPYYEGWWDFESIIHECENPTDPEFPYEDVENVYSGGNFIYRDGWEKKNFNYQDVYEIDEEGTCILVPGDPGEEGVEPEPNEAPGQLLPITESVFGTCSQEGSSLAGIGGLCPFVNEEEGFLFPVTNSTTEKVFTDWKEEQLADGECFANFSKGLMPPCAEEQEEECQKIVFFSLDFIRSGKELFKSETLSSEDTEADAIARAVATEGEECSTIWQLRMAGEFAFTYRTAKYTAKIGNLCRGREYQGCIRIRKREAYRGTPPEEADLEWHEIEPDIIAPFFPEPDEDGFTVLESLTDIELPFEQGYEYEIIGGSVWPVGVGCECPTEYVEPEPE